MRDRDRDLILARRARFVGVALTSAGLMASATGSCGGETDSNGRPLPDASSDTSSSSGGTGGLPQPCLSGAPGFGGEPGTGGFGNADSGETLDAAENDADADDAGGSDAHNDAPPDAQAGSD